MMMNSIEKQQLEVLLCIGVKSDTAPSSTVNKKDFQRVAGWLGLMLGFLTVAADLGGHAFLLGMNAPVLSIQTILSVTTLWSLGVSVTTGVFYLLIRQLIAMFLPKNDKEEDNLLDAFDDGIILWAIVGVAVAHSILLPTMTCLLCSIVFLTLAIGLYFGIRSSAKRVNCCFSRKTTALKERESKQNKGARLMIV